MLAPTCSSRPTPASASQRVDMVARIPWSISFFGADRHSTWTRTWILREPTKPPSTGMHVIQEGRARQSFRRLEGQPQDAEISRRPTISMEMLRRSRGVPRVHPLSGCCGLS
jgi:hypothetical protein